jgi:hypothetical protein
VRAERAVGERERGVEQAEIARESPTEEKGRVKRRSRVRRGLRLPRAGGGRECAVARAQPWASGERESDSESRLARSVSSRVRTDHVGERQRGRRALYGRQRGRHLHGEQKASCRAAER